MLPVSLVQGRGDILPDFLSILVSTAFLKVEGNILKIKFVLFKEKIAYIYILEHIYEYKFFLKA